MDLETKLMEVKAHVTAKIILPWLIKILLEPNIFEHVWPSTWAMNGENRP